jgi:hypothetical protein
MRYTRREKATWTHAGDPTICAQISPGTCILKGISTTYAQPSATVTQDTSRILEPRYGRVWARTHPMSSETKSRRRAGQRRAGCCRDVALTRTPPCFPLLLRVLEAFLLCVAFRPALYVRLLLAKPAPWNRPQPASQEKSGTGSSTTAMRTTQPSTRLHRFHSMHIFWHKMYTVTHAGLLSLLCDPSSSAPSYVRSLYREERESRSARRPAGPFLNTALPRMRCRDMTALRSLTIKYAHWDLVTPDARACLEQLCTSLQRLALVSPRMCGVTPVLELVCAAPVLQTLAPGRERARCRHARAANWTSRSALALATREQALVSFNKMHPLVRTTRWSTTSSR